MSIGYPFFGDYNVGLFSFLGVLICLFLSNYIREYLKSSWNVRELKNWRNYFWVIGGFFINWIVYSFLHNTPFLTILDLFNSSVYLNLLSTITWQKTQYLLFTGLIAPICEEIIMRGIIFQKIMEEKGLIMGVAMSSIIFAMSHHSLNILYIVQLLVAGISLALTYRYTRSLLFPILLHGVWNIFYLYYSVIF